MRKIISKKSDDRNDKEDLVITPGGLRPRKVVKQVGPDEIVRRNEDGTYTVVRRKRTTSQEKDHDD